MTKEKVIMHMDMDAFFASCLQAIHPELRKKPVVVAYNQSRSIIVTSSYEARGMGIKTGMPVFKAKEVTNNQVIQVNPDFKVFTAFSQEIFSIIYNEFSNILEIASIDECYIDVTNKWQKYGSPRKMAIEIKNTIKERLGVTCSIGISNNKFLAKMVGKVNKPDGVSVLNPDNYRAFLWGLDISEMFGVGPSLEKRLREININTIRDLALADDQIIIDNFGKIGLELKAHANGKGSDYVQVEHNDYKNISNEITFENPIDNEDELFDVIFGLTKHVLERAEKRKMTANTFGVTIRYKWNKKQGEEFDKIKHHKNISKQIKLKDYTNNFEEIYVNLRNLIEDNYDISKGISLVGVSMKNVVKKDKIPTQLTIDEIQIDANIKNILNDSKLKKYLKTGDQIEDSKGKLSGQTKYIKKEEIHYNPKAK